MRTCCVCRRVHTSAGVCAKIDRRMEKTKYVQTPVWLRKRCCPNIRRSAYINDRYTCPRLVIKVKCAECSYSPQHTGASHKKWYFPLLGTRTFRLCLLTKRIRSALIVVDPVFSILIKTKWVFFLPAVPE